MDSRIKMKEKSMEIKALVLPESSSNGESVRIVDEEGHLLFCFNPTTDCIEIKSSFRSGSKRLYAVNVFELRMKLKRSILQDEPIGEVAASPEKIFNADDDGLKIDVNQKSIQPDSSLDGELHESAAASHDIENESEED